MGLESATYIGGLNASNPVTTDPKTEGDDHIRLLKSTVLATFPNVTAAVTPTHTELNYVDGVTSAIQTQLDAKAPLAAPAITGNATFTSNSQTNYASAAVEIVSTSGDVFLALWTSPSYATVFKQTRGADGVSVLNSNNDPTNITAGDFSIASDERLKTNIRLIDDVWKVIGGLAGYRFTYSKTGRNSVGLIAQEAQKVLPELVRHGDGGMLEISYPQIVAVLVEAIKDLRAEVDALKAA
jgi:hypothetical protein